MMPLRRIIIRMIVHNLKLMLRPSCVCRLPVRISVFRHVVLGVRRGSSRIVDILIAAISTVTAWIADCRPACYSGIRMNARDATEFAACTWNTVVLLVMIPAARIRGRRTVGTVAIVTAGSTMMLEMTRLSTSTGIALLAVRTMTTSKALIAIGVRDDQVIVRR